ncbi:hypothetical protein [Mycoplasma ovis]|nr:hypothetical protein [Mycoplasma ovis]
MGFKSKLLLGSLGFMGANGVVFPALNHNNWLLNRIQEFDWGGTSLA